MIVQNNPKDHVTKKTVAEAATSIMETPWRPLRHCRWQNIESRRIVRVMCHRRLCSRY